MEVRKAIVNPASFRSLALLAGVTVMIGSLLGAVIGSGETLFLLLIFLLIPFFLMAAQPILGMLAIAATIPFEQSLALSEGVTATKFLGIAVFGTWIIYKLFYRESWRSIVQSNFVRIGLVYLLYAVVSVTWAEYRSDSYTGLFQLAQLFLWALILIDLTNSWKRVDWLVKVLVLSSLIASILATYQFQTGTVSRAGEGLAGVNSTAELLVVFMPFAFHLVRMEKSRFWRVIGVLYVFFAYLGVAVTLSRMSLLLLPLITLVEWWQTIREHSGRKYFVLLVSAVIVAIALLPRELVAQRMQTVFPYLRTTVELGEDEDVEVSGRPYHLRVGLAMFLDHPIFGVGYKNYGAHFLNDYQFRVPGASDLYTTKRSPHSSHIGILADLGLAGFTIWIALLAATWRQLMTARSLSREKKSTIQHSLVHAVYLGFLLEVLAYGWYSNLHTTKLFWTLMGLSVAVWRLTKQDSQVEPQSEQRHILNLAPVDA